MPLVLLSAFALFFWVAEAYLHAHVFNQGFFLEHLLSPAPHEAWMRGLVVVMLMIIAFVWSRALSMRQRAIAQLASYQEQLREASARIAYGDSEERRELADRLHEHVGQTLSAARLYLASVEGAECDESEREAIRTAERIVGRAIADCRDIAQELSPPSLDEYGLGPALEALAQRVMRQTGTSVEVDANEMALPLERESLLAMFHVLAEVVEGAAANAGEQSVRISSQLDDSSLSVSVSYSSHSQLDLFGACERMGRAGGSLMRSEDELGTVVTVRAPRIAA